MRNTFKGSVLNVRLPLKVRNTWWNASQKMDERYELTSHKTALRFLLKACLQGLIF